jgi:ribosomal protein S19
MKRKNKKKKLTVKNLRLNFGIINKITRTRSYTIDRILYKKRYTIYAGKYYHGINVRRAHFGHKLGEYALTKKLGPTIHDSERNRKRREKLKNKR